MRTSGVGHPMGSTVTFGAAAWANSSKNHVPGNLAGALALEAAGPDAARVRVGYFVRGNVRKATSAGTRASVHGCPAPSAVVIPCKNTIL